MPQKPVILIVDDAAENIQMMASCLKDAYHLKVASDGQKCLQICEQTPPPDLVLLDINMPGMDGYEVCRKLKSADSTKDIAVIFVTGMNSDEDEEKGLAIGAVDYITKPVRPAIVRARVKNQIVIKRQTDELTHMALFDQLTGLYNRHYMMASFSQKISRCHRHHTPLCLAMVDLDYFKKVNDEYGHYVGDVVLKEVSNHFRNACRQEDVVARMGGEEFAMIFDQCELDKAYEKCERLREVISEIDFNGPRITISIGLAELYPKESFEDLLKRADNACYQAKGKGRNNVMVSNSGLGNAYVS